MALLTAFVFILGSVGMAFADTVYVGNVGFDMDKMVNDDAYNDGFNEYFATHTNDPFIVDMAGMTFDVADYLNAPDGTSMPDFAASNPAEAPAEAVIWDGEGKPGESVGELTVENVEAVDANTISVKFEGIEEAVKIELEEALVEGENEITFTYKGQEFTWAVDYEAPADELVVKSVSAIDEYGVTVKFEATTEDNDEANVVVKDGEGNVIETEARLIAEGETTATFDFVTPFETDYEFTGVWTVNGVEYSFDAINQLKDIIDAAADGNQITFQAALDAAGITYEDELKIGDYLTAVRKANLEEYTNTLADVQEIIDEIDGTAADEAADAAKVKAVVDAKTQSQLLTALSANFDHVNPEWIVEYANHVMAGEGENAITLLELDDVKDVTVSEIQAAIYSVNEAEIEKAKVKVKTAADQAKVTALIEAWMKPDAEGETDKEEAIEDSKLAEAAYKVVEANTANRLYNALVAFADLADDDTIINPEDIKEENKDFYFKAYRDEDGKLNLVDDENDEIALLESPKAIVTKGNDLAKDAQEEIDGRITDIRLGKPGLTDGKYNYVGYSVSFNFDKVEKAAIKGVVVELYDSKDNLLSTTTGTQKVIDLANDWKRANAGVLTAPFDLFDDYDYEKDGYWVNDGWAKDVFTQPDGDKVIVKIEYEDATAKNTGSSPTTGIVEINDIANKFVDAIVASEDVAEVEGLLVDLANAGQLSSFLEIAAADRTFVAEEIVAEEEKAEWDLDDLNNYIGTDIKTNIIDAVVNAANKLTKAFVKEDVVAVLENFEAYNELGALAKLDAQKAFHALLTFDDETDALVEFTSYTAVAALVEQAIK